MNLDSIPLFSMLKGRLGYLNQREQLVAQNVANADTPGYTPKDLKPFTFGGQLDAAQSGGGTLAMVTTSSGHLSGTTARTATSWSPQATPDSETKLDGNQVDLEDQMVKMNESRMDYDAAITFYQKSMDLIRTAARKPGS